MLPQVQFVTPSRLLGCGDTPFISLWDLNTGETLAAFDYEGMLNYGHIKIQTLAS